MAFFICLTHQGIRYPLLPQLFLSVKISSVSPYGISIVEQIAEIRCNEDANAGVLSVTKAGKCVMKGLLLLE
jgi:hypothetical protein